MQPARVALSNDMLTIDLDQTLTGMGFLYNEGLGIRFKEMGELDIYQRAIDVITAMVDPSNNPVKQINCFFVGYIEDLNTEKLEKPDNPKYAYSRTAVANGKPFKKEFPIMGMWPPVSSPSNFSNLRATEDYDMTCLILDNFRYHQDNTDNSQVVNTRELEEVWNDTKTMGYAFLRALNDPTCIVLSGRFTRVTAFGADDLSGVRIDFKVRVPVCL